MTQSIVHFRSQSGIVAKVPETMVTKDAIKILGMERKAAAVLVVI